MDSGCTIIPLRVVLQTVAELSMGKAVSCNLLFGESEVAKD